MSDWEDVEEAPAKSSTASAPTSSDDWVDADAPHNTVLDEPNQRVVAVPQSLNHSETKYVMDKEIDGKKGFLGQQHVGEEPPVFGVTTLKGLAAGVIGLGRVKAGLDLSDAEQMQEGKRSLFQDAQDYANERGGGGIMAPMTDNEERVSKQAGDVLAEKSRELIKNNKLFIDKNGLDLRPDASTREQIEYRIGAAVPTIAAAVGVTVMSKNPMMTGAAVTALTSPQMYSETYIEADETGKFKPDEKRTIAGGLTALSAPLNFIGEGFFAKALMGNSAVKRVAQGAVTQATLGGAQSAANTGVLNATGVRDETFGEAMYNIGLDTISMGIVGGVSGAVVGRSASAKAKEQGVPPEVADAFGKSIEENYAAAHENIGEFADKELSPLAAEPENNARSKEIIDKYENGEDFDPNTLNPEERKVYDQYKEVFDKFLGKPEADVAAEPIDARAEKAMTTALEDTGLSKDQADEAISQFAKTGEVDASAYDEALAGRVKAVLERFGQNREEIVKGRVRYLDDQVEGKLKEIDAAEEKLAAAMREGKGTKRLTTARDKLFKEWEALDSERAAHLTSEGKPIGKDVLDKDVTVKGKDIENARELSRDEAARQVNAAFREARTATRSDVKGIQKRITDLIRKSGLSRADQAEFLEAVTHMNTAEKLKGKSMTKLQQRIESKLAEANRKSLVSDLKKTLDRIGDSGAIAVDYINQVKELVKDIDLTNRSQKTTDRLQSTLEYMKRTGEPVPESVLKKLERLNKRNVKDVPTQELKELLDEINDLEKVGRTKLRLMEAQRERIKTKRITDLKKDTRRLSQTNLAEAPIGERLAAIERFKNIFREQVNKLQRFNLYKNPMDVIFDILDGNADYKGSNSKIFKRTIDESHSNYQQLKENATREVKNLQDKLGLTSEQMEKIGAYAAAQQEGGVEKLANSGYKESEVKNLKLTPEEKQMYDLMRVKLDSMVPQLREIMRTVYNQNFKGVKDYFPFMTDFEKMQGVEIQDMFGDKVPLMVQKKNVEKGFTQSRTGAGKQKIRIDAMGVFLRHVDNAAYLIEMGKNIRDLSDVALSNDYRRAAGDLGQQAVGDWLDLLARKGNAAERVPFIDGFRRNVGAAILGFKLSSVLVQPTALMDGASLLGGRHVSEGVGHMASRDWREFLIKNMPEYRERVGDDVAFLEMGGDSKIAHVREAGMYALQKLDEFAAGAVAIGAYKKAVKEMGGEVDLNNLDPAAIQYAQLIMRRTQSSSFAKDAAPVISQGKLTGNVSVDKMIFQFQSFMLNRWSLIQHDMIEAGVARGKTKQALNIATWLTLANFSEYYIRHWTKDMISVLTGNKDDKKDDDSVTEKIAKQAISNVPVVSTLVNSAQYGSNPVPAMSMLEKITEEAAYAEKSKSGDKKARHALSAAILLTGTAFGIPGTMQAQQIQSQAMKPKK